MSKLADHVELRLEYLPRSSPVAEARLAGEPLLFRLGPLGVFGSSRFHLHSSTKEIETKSKVLIGTKVAEDFFKF